MEKINVAELLRNCPKGMELDCTMFDEVKLVGVDEICITPFPIRVRRVDGYNMTLTKYGQYADADFAKCVIFPKGKTTWEGFVPPSKFKDGDIAISDKGDIHLLRTTNSSYCAYRERWEGLPKFDHTITTEVKAVRIATEEEKQKLFKAIKDNGYKWNPQTKTLEKLPKFKVGDRVKHTLTYTSGIVVKVDDKGYYINNYPKGEGVCFISFTLEEYYELVPNKFDITTLTAFKSEVLVRHTDIGLWKPAIFGFISGDNRFGVVGGNAYNQCIPFKGNEYLLGTTDDCADFYKTWK